MEEVIVKKKRRGRPKGMKNGSGGQSNSIGSTVIIDPIIAPYKISIDPECYTVTDEVDPIDTGGIVIRKTYGYFNTLPSALRKITKMKLMKNKKYTLQGYINEFNEMITQFESKFEKYEV